VFKLKVTRFSENEKQSLSNFTVFDEYECDVLSGYILELPYRNNETGVSRINEGEYNCVKRNSPKYGDHFHVLDVFDRLYILIHVGNYYKNTRGCLLPGDNLIDIDGDGMKDVTNSGDTMGLLNKILPNNFKLIVENKIK